MSSDQESQNTGVASGMLIGEFFLRRRLGSGATGEVWLATHHVWVDHLVAVKIPTNPEYLKNIRQEGLVQFDLSRLKSEHIVAVLGLSTAHNPPYLVMEYVDGEDLRRRLNKVGTFSLPESLRILKGILLGLKVAHEAGVIHRDLKPENILLTLDGIPKVSDFSLALRAPDAKSLRMSIETDAGAAASLAGTLMYMAPEQRRGEKVDRRSDMYSVGLLLFEMLTGELPQPGDRIGDFVPDVPDHIEVLFSRCFARYEKRFRDAGEMLAQLEKGDSATIDLAAARKKAKPVMSTRDVGFNDPSRSVSQQSESLETQEATKAGKTPSPASKKSKPVLSTRSIESVVQLQREQQSASSTQEKHRASAPDSRDSYEPQCVPKQKVNPKDRFERTRPSARPRPADLSEVERVLNELPADESLTESQRRAVTESGGQDVSRVSREEETSLPPLKSLYRDEPSAKGASLYARGQFSEATKEFQKLTQSDPECFAAKKGLAMSLFKLGRPKDALDAYRAALELRPESAEIWNNIGVVFLSLNRHRDAERALLRAIELKPRYAPAHSNLGAAYQALGKVEEARKASATALEIDPDNFQAAYNVGL